MQNVITVEEHFYCPEVAERQYQYMKDQDGVDFEDAYHSLPIGPNKARLDKDFAKVLADIGDARLRWMDANGIKRQIISYDNISPQDIPGQLGVDLCRQANDYAAEKIRKHPDRFSALAALPLGMPEKAAEELERTVKQLGFVGAMITGTYRGHFLEEPQFLPVFEKAQELDVPVYLHPAEINPDVQKIYYNNDNWNPLTNGILQDFGYGWHLEDGIVLLRLILSGIFDRLPDLRIITGHWGEAVGLWVKSRISLALSPQTTGLAKPLEDYYRENIYISPSGMFDKNLYQIIKELVGVDHILWSEDYPQMQTPDSADRMLQFSMTAEEREKVAHKNAKKLFHI